MATPAANDREILAPLSRFERFSYRLARFLNRWFKWLFTFYQQQILGIVFPLCVGRSVRPHGLEHARALPERAPILLVSNHRSFFDFYVLSTVLYKIAGVGRNIYFPVRSNFFYDHPLGLVINHFVGGWSMYPPIFRDRKKLIFNRHSIEETAALLRQPNSLVGIHPEGTRNKGPDPYKLLPAQPGVGRVAMLARATVLPVFILGQGNSFLETVKRNWMGGQDIIIVFGPPIDLSDLYAEGDRPAVHKKIADRMLDVIRKLGDRERELRAAAGLPSLAPPPEPTQAAG
ncbi:MAG TPA: lysophospholipid acyltransferase family protein [Myxococcales bacterium]|nr:lysophospholipid acyltransferase family protein [Myxococcales bacterium]